MYLCSSKFIQPKTLRFRGLHALKVSPAPEPSNIIWQNLDTSSCEKFVRRFLGVVAVLVSVRLLPRSRSRCWECSCSSVIAPPRLHYQLLLVVSVIVVFFASVSQQKVMRNIPTAATCDNSVATAYGVPTVPPSPLPPPLDHALRLLYAHRRRRAVLCRGASWSATGVSTRAVEPTRSS